MSLVNNCRFLGRIGGELELKATPSGQSVVSTRFAVKERRKDANGELQEYTTWLTLVFWNKRAETAASILVQGSLILVDAQFRPRIWEGKDGIKRLAAEFVVHAFQLVRQPNGHQRDTGEYEEQREGETEEFPF